MRSGASKRASNLTSLRKLISITNVLGMTDDGPPLARWRLTLTAKLIGIDPILEKGETDLFVMVATKPPARKPTARVVTFTCRRPTHPEE